MKFLIYLPPQDSEVFSKHSLGLRHAELRAIGWVDGWMGGWVPAHPPANLIAGAERAGKSVSRSARGNSHAFELSGHN